jgi:glycosyltransferase involved in cell wall biosynthesis
MRYAGVKNERICFVSDEAPHNASVEIVVVPEEMNEVSATELILNCKVKAGKIVCKCQDKPASQLKVALVGNWKMQCGLATYSEHLYPELIKHLGEFKLFIEHNEHPTGNNLQLGQISLTKDQVVSCWKRGDFLQDLIVEIKSYDPDIVLIQHEFGLFPNAAAWLSLMTQLNDYRVIVVMHSVFHHKDKTIVEAAMPEIIVHLSGGKDVLKEEKGVAGQVHIIPHGCYSYDKERLWNFYKTEHTIVQAGFLFRYKGWQEALKTVALLKDKYPDIFFTGICSESPYNKTDHQIYFNELIALIKRLGIENHVSLIRGFQSDQVLDSYLRTNRVALFPYIAEEGHAVFGASGAARLAMSKGLPVISSTIAHFSDLPTIKATTPEEMSVAIDQLFSDGQAYQEQLDRQITFLQDNSWEQTAFRYIEVFERKTCK